MFDCDGYLTSESDESLPPSPIYDRYQSRDGYPVVPPPSMGFDMSKVECYRCYRKGHFARECRSPKDIRRNGAAKPQRRNVPVETSTSNALVLQYDGVGSYDWSFQAEEEPTNYALMAFTSSSSSSDNGVVSWSKACTKAYATLQSHYELLIDDYRKSQFDVISYKTGLESVKARLLVYQQNESVFEEDIKLLKLESDESLPPSPIYDRYQSRDGYPVVPPPYTGTFMPPKPDLVFHNAPNDVETIHTTFNIMLSPTKPDKDLPVTTIVPNIHVTRPRLAKPVVTKSHSPPRRYINRSPSPKVSNFPPKVTAVKAPMVLYPTSAPGVMPPCGMPKELTRKNKMRIQHSTFAVKKNKIRNRMSAFVDKETSKKVDENIVAGLTQMLDRSSVLAQSLRMAKEWCHSYGSQDFSLILLSERTSSRQYNAPTVSEVTTLIVNDFGNGFPLRDIILNQNNVGSQSISELHPSYVALLYPLLFLYRKDGFHEKIEYYLNVELLDDLTINQILRDFCTVLYVIEFQKWGFPHAHILLWLEERYKCMTPDEINDIISAELPSPAEDPDGYKLVSKYMLHGPCDKDATYTEGKCSKHYPKLFLAKTIIGEDGYPIYRRRDNKVTVKKGKVTYDNQHMVPYNQYLLLKYHAHINVELCNRSKAFKYLFKYLNKGPDRATIFIHEKVMARPDGASVQISQLNYHLPNQNAVTLRDSEDLSAFLEREGINITMFTDWFELNKRDTATREFTYAEIPQHYVWH
nr:hypothetical protein [Tanacetum cinerariifolium]